MCSPQENTLVFWSCCNIFTIVAEKYKKKIFLWIISEKIPSNWLISFYELFWPVLFLNFLARYRTVFSNPSCAFWFFTAFFLKLVYNLIYEIMRYHETFGWATAKDFYKLCKIFSLKIVAEVIHPSTLLHSGRHDDL